MVVSIGFVKKENMKNISMLSVVFLSACVTQTPTDTPKEIQTEPVEYNDSVYANIFQPRLPNKTDSVWVLNGNEMHKIPVWTMSFLDQLDFYNSTLKTQNAICFPMEFHKQISKLPWQKNQTLVY